MPHGIAPGWILWLQHLFVVFAAGLLDEDLDLLGIGAVWHVDDAQGVGGAGPGAPPGHHHHRRPAAPPR